MASTLSNYLQNAVASWITGSAMPAAPATIYIALYTVAPTNAGGGTEVSGGGYDRVPVTTSTGLSKSGNSPVSVTNTGLIDYGTTTAAWGTIVAAAIMDAATNGNQLAWGSLTSNVTVSNGDDVQFQAGSLVFTID